MNIRFVRILSVAALFATLCEQRSVKLSAQQPAQPQEAGSYVAYGGGGSLTGALGVTSAVVSPPLGLRTPNDAFADIVDAATSSGHTLIARRDGSVWSMGANDRGQLGLGYVSDPIESPTQIPGLAQVVKVVAVGASSYAIDRDGALWVWGDDSVGQLGIGQPGGAIEQLTPIMNPVPLVTDVDAGADFAVAADRNGAIWSWGANAESQLGAPGPDRSTPARISALQNFFAIDVAAGAATALARSSAGEVIAWGSNGWHQIADAGATIDAGTIVATDVISMSAGDGHIVVAHTDGSVQARGANWAGQLGIGTQTPVTGMQTVTGLSGVVDVAAGAAHSVAVTNDGRAFGWGFNHKRQLLSPTPDVFTATPQRVLDLPQTARFVRAKSESTLLLSDPASDTTPPVISTVTPNPATLSPPNRQMVPVGITVSATDETSVASCAVTSVTSSEPPSPGESDWTITAPLAVQLRAERDPHNDGRVYAIHVQCVDEAGNASSGSTTVLVPKRKK